MAREWIEFVQSQRIAWSNDDLGGLRTGATITHWVKNWVKNETRPFQR